MNDRVKFELLEEVAGLAAADALERAAAPAKRGGFRPGLCDMIPLVGGRDAAVAALAKKVRVDDDGCHIWHGSLNAYGYGTAYINKRVVSVHRLSYEIANGPIPSTGSPDPLGWLVLHRCDVPACCNPSHLYLGTAKDNAKDRSDRCRMRRGHRVLSDGLNKDRVDERWGTPFYEIEGVIQSLAEWAEKFGISTYTLSQRLVAGRPVEHLGLPSARGYRNFGPKHVYRKFSGEAAVMEYLASQAGDR